MMFDYVSVPEMKLSIGITRFDCCSQAFVLLRQKVFELVSYYT
jgi:hypothetical protein